MLPWYGSQRERTADLTVPAMARLVVISLGKVSTFFLYCPLIRRQGFGLMVNGGLLRIQPWAVQVRSVGMILPSRQCGLGVGIICLVFSLIVWFNRPVVSQNISDGMKPATTLMRSICGRRWSWQGAA